MPGKRFGKNGDSEPLEPVTPEIIEPEEVEAEPEAEEDLPKLLAEKEEELKQAQDRVLRIAAELENTRKRLEREKAEGINFANETIMRGLLPVLDNLERALEHAEKEASYESLLEGVRMTLKGFLDVFGKFGGTPFESVGEMFDPNRHEAVTQENTSDYPDKTVVREFQKGYMLRDRLLRPAMVVVARNTEDSGKLIESAASGQDNKPEA